MPEIPDIEALDLNLKSLFTAGKKLAKVKIVTPVFEGIDVLNRRKL